MARSSRWSKEQRATLLQMVRDGVSEQDIRQRFAVGTNKGGNHPMTAAEFAQQLKQAMVEAGEIKQGGARKKAERPSVYVVTNTGRLTITDFVEVTGAQAGSKFVLESPRGRSQAWRLLPVA